MAIFITIVIASGATYAATTMYQSNIVGYDNTTSGLRSTNVHSALDELYGNVAEVILNIKNLLGNTTMGTTANTITGAIAEHENDISSINNNKVIYSSGTNYIRFADGTQICWGIYTLGAWMGVVDFQISFKDTNYAVVVTRSPDAGEATVMTAVAYTTSKFFIYGDTGWRANWIAIGKWK